MLLMTALTRHQGASALILLFGTLVSLSVCGQATNDAAPFVRAQSTDWVQVPLIRLNSEEIPGDAAAKDFFVQLPEHVRFQAGCELRLALYPSLEVLSRLCTIKAWINGKPLSGAIVEAKTLHSTNDRAIRLKFPLPEGSLVPGWDRIAVRFILKQPATTAEAAKGAGKWTILRSDSYPSIGTHPFPTLFRPARSRSPRGTG